MSEFPDEYQLDYGVDAYNSAEPSEEEYLNYMQEDSSGIIPDEQYYTGSSAVPEQTESSFSS